jgi:site-specific DNA-methyltransferase (adenine-specific)
MCFEHELIHLFKKPGTPPKPTCSARERERAAIPNPQWRALFSDIWEFPGARADRAGHPALFPEELPRRLLRMFTFPDDIALDPFAGSGMTCAVTRRMGRRYIGIDINADYVSRARDRCQQTGLEALAPTIGSNDSENQKSLGAFAADGGDD